MRGRKKSVFAVILVTLMLSFVMGIGAFAESVYDRNEMIEQAFQKIREELWAQTDYDAGTTVAVDLNEFHLNKDDGKRFFDEVKAHCPVEVAFFKPTQIYHYSTGLAYIEFETVFSESDTMKYKAELEREISYFVSTCDANWSDYEKILAVYDYLVVNCSYDLTYQKRSVFNVLVENSSVCDGYAQAFILLMNRLGFEDISYVNSSALNHAWNIVKLDGEYYNVDATWGDSIPDYPGRVNYSYFLKSTAWFTTTGNHDSTDWYISGKNAPKMDDCDSTKYDTSNIPGGSRWPFAYRDGKWYGVIDAETQGELAGFAYDSSLGVLVKQTTIKGFKKVWKVPGENSYYGGVYSGLFMVDGVVYFNDETNVYGYDISKGVTSVVFTEPGELLNQYRIYGLEYNHHTGYAQCVMMASPNTTKDAQGNSYYDYEPLPFKVKCVDHVDANGDGLCDDCKDILDGTTAFLGTEATIEDEIRLTFHVSLESLPEGSYIEITRFTGNDTGADFADRKTVEVDASADLSNYTFDYSVAAKEIADTIQFKLVDGANDYTVYRYSVQRYLESLIGSAESEGNTAYVPFAQSMLNYGAYAQAYFKYNTENPANANCAKAVSSAQTVQAAVQDCEKKIKMSMGDFAITPYGSSLVLESKVMIRHYFTLSGEYSDSQLEEAGLVRSGNYYYKELTGMSPIQYSRVVTDATGGIEISYSVYTYIKSMLNNSDTSAEMKNLLCAMYDCSEEALILANR